MNDIHVNRKTELQEIIGALDTLLDGRRLLRTPIIELHGVEGIGKSTLLREVIRQCSERKIKPLVLHQIKDALLDFIQPTQELLQEMIKGVVIIDSLDDVSEEQLKVFEEGLIDLMTHSFLLVVLASRSGKKFESSRYISRLLTRFHLQPLDRMHCSVYLDRYSERLSQVARDTIVNWTHGYPLAMNVMVDTILSHELELSKKEDRDTLMSLLVEKIIYKNLLAKANNDSARFEKLITFLSIPRRFNPVIMQQIIEHFVQEFELENTLEYVSLPHRINTVTPVLYWDIRHVGYCIDSPVRNLFLLKLEYQDSAKYYEAHTFLADMNKSLATQVTGLDHIRYVKEYLYHFIKSGATIDELEQEITHTVHQLAESGSIDVVVQFEKELSEDPDINDALADKIEAVKSFIHEQIKALQEPKETVVSPQDNVES